MSNPTTKLSQDSITAVYCTALKISFDFDPEERVTLKEKIDSAGEVAGLAIEELKDLIEAYEGDEV